MNYAEYEKVASSVDRFGAAQSPQVYGQPLKLTGLDKGKSNDLAWPKLDQIPEPTDAGPTAFPFTALGPILGNAAKAISRDVQAPDSLAGGSVLAAASLAVQALANVVMPHGARSPLSVYVITGAGSGDRKTGVDAVACKEIEAVRQKQARQLAKDSEQYALGMQKRGNNDSYENRPTPKSLTTSNATIEGIGKLLKNQSHVGVFSAEGGEMLNGYSMRGEQRSSALAFYLKGWSGESIDSLRSGDGLTVLLNRRIAMHVLVQPVLLGQLLSDPLAQGQGLLARCLIAQPETLAGHRPYRDCNPHENPEVVTFNAVIEGLLATTLPLRQDGDGYELEPRDLHLSDAAKELWVAFYNVIELQQASGEDLDGARPFASKAAEHAARIAGIITLCENPHATLIDCDAMDGAIQVTGFYLTEHIRLIGAGRDERHHDKLRTLQVWMQLKGNRVLKKELLQNTPRQIRNLKAAGINLLTNELVQRGYLRERESEWEVRHV